MRLLRESRFLVGSVAIHVAALMWIALRPPPPPPAEKQAILVEVRRPEPERPRPVEPAPEPVRAPETQPIREPERQPQKQPEKQPERQPEKQPEAQPQQPQPQPQPPEAQPQPQPQPPEQKKPIDLFNHQALERATRDSGGTIGVPGAQRDPRGHTTRGVEDPNAERSTAQLKREADANMREFIKEDRVMSDIAKGKVAPLWREAERQITASFNPPAEVFNESAGKSLMNIFTNKQKGGGVPQRGVDDSVGAGNPYGGGFNGSLNTPTGSEAGNVPHMITIVEVELSASGEVLAAVVKKKSGVKKYDAEALAVVLASLKKNKGPLEEKQTMVARYSVEAWLETKGVAGGMGFTFDESGTQKTSADYVGKRGVRKIKLVWLEPKT